MRQEEILSYLLGSKRPKSTTEISRHFGASNIATHQKLTALWKYGLVSRRVATRDIIGRNMTVTKWRATKRAEEIRKQQGVKE